MLRLPALSTDLAFGDEVVERVEEAWRSVLGGEVGGDGEGYLEFEERGGDDDDGDVGGF